MVGVRIRTNPELRSQAEEAQVRPPLLTDDISPGRGVIIGSRRPMLTSQAEKVGIAP